MRSIGYDRRRLRMMAALAKGGTVLDIGYAQSPNVFLKNLHCVGYDLNLPAGGMKVYDEQIQGDVKDIRDALKDRKFDTIICGELIEHLENPYQFLRDVRPLLAENGRLVISTPNPLGFPVLICEALRIQRFFYTKEHLYYFLPRWVYRLIEKCGMQVDMIKAVGFWLPFGVIRACPIAMSYQVIYVAHKVPYSV